jgi:hypothetical protein
MTARGDVAAAGRTRWWRTPSGALILLAPLIGELLMGAIRLSYIFAIVPATLIWGCGALMIREVVYRWRGGWTSTLVLGLAVSVAFEFLVQQTSLAPIPWLQQMSIPVYDRIWGVNWLWFFFMLGYEAVWIVLVPILITELLFPQRRHDAWLRPRGLAIGAVGFVLGSVFLWALWTKVTMPLIFHMPAYQPPITTLGLGVMAILLLVATAYALRSQDQNLPITSRSAPQPWLVGVAAMLFGFPWWGLMTLVFAPRPALPLWVPLVVGTAWAAAAFLVIRRWSMTRGWSDRHRWALAFGALLVCMLAGFLGSSTWPAIDLVAKIVLNVIASVRMMSLAQVIWRREGPTPRSV